MPNKPCAYGGRWIISCTPGERAYALPVLHRADATGHDGTNGSGVADQRAVLRATGDTVEPVTLTERCRMRNCWESLCLNLSPPEWRVKNDNFPIIERKLDRAEFIEYDEVGAGK